MEYVIILLVIILLIIKIKKMAITQHKPSEWSAATKTAVLTKLKPQACVIVETTDDAEQNGANLLSAYATAKTLTPNGAALSADNRACVIVPPGVYDLGDDGEGGEYTALTLDTEFVDIIGLSSDNKQQYIKGTPPAINSGVIVQTADDVRIVNLTLKTLTEVEELPEDDTGSAAYFPSTNLSSVVIENCEFIEGDGEEEHFLLGMRTCVEYSGTYIDCTGGCGAFGVGGIASGIFNNCTGGENSFGGSGTASGTFNNCTGGSAAFGGEGTASGIFNNCTGGEGAFGGGGTASGTFTNCTGGECSFGGEGTALGVFTNCTGDDGSFGGGGGTLSGQLYFCRLTTGTFQDLAEGGKLRACVDGNNNFIAELDYEPE